MGDSTSARIFGDFFRNAAKLKCSKKDPHVKFMWCSQLPYDFHPSDMECDEELIELGLARRGIDPDYDPEEKTVLYDSMVER